MSFWKTTITVTVLSEGPYEAPDGLDGVYHDIVDGECCGDWRVSQAVELSEAQMKEACLAMGTDPVFFGIKEEK